MAPDQLSTTLFATLIASLCYGIAVTVFIESIATTMRKRRATGQLNILLATASVLIFMLATVNVMGLWVNIHAAVTYPKGAQAYLDLIRTTAKTVIQTGQVGSIILADALVVYRAFIVWGNNIYIIIIPCMTFVATVTSGISFVKLQHTTGRTTSIFSPAVTQWTVAFLLSSFATTIYSTGLIAYKLLRAQRQLRQNDGIAVSGGLRLRRILRIIVESAALYSLNHLLYAILYEVKTNVESTPSFLEASLASVTCSLIIVRSESVIKRPQTFGNSGSLAPGAVPEKHLKTQDGMVFALRSMGTSNGVTSTIGAPTHVDSQV